MKKIIPALAVLGGVAAFAVYKLKKEEKKHVVDLDQGLLYDEENEDDIDESLQQISAFSHLYPPISKIRFV